jgi:hypothetical protein
MSVSAQTNTQFPERIPYAFWINSQLSIARFYGGITVNNKHYVIDRETNDLVIAVRRKHRKEKKEREKKSKKNLSEQPALGFN